MIIVLPYLSGRGCDYLLGFLVGETSQWESALWESNNPIPRSHVENYEDFHLIEAMADRGITWLNRRLAIKIASSSKRDI